MNQNDLVISREGKESQLFLYQNKPLFLHLTVFCHLLDSDAKIAQKLQTL